MPPDEGPELLLIQGGEEGDAAATKSGTEETPAFPIDLASIRALVEFASHTTLPGRNSVTSDFDDGGDDSLVIADVFARAVGVDVEFDEGGEPVDVRGQMARLESDPLAVLGMAEIASEYFAGLGGSTMCRMPAADAMLLIGVDPDLMHATSGHATARDVDSELSGESDIVDAFGREAAHLFEKLRGTRLKAMMRDDPSGYEALVERGQVAVRTFVKREGRIPNITPGSRDYRRVLGIFAEPAEPTE